LHDEEKLTMQKNQIEQDALAAEWSLALDADAASAFAGSSDDSADGVTVDNVIDDGADAGFVVSGFLLQLRESIGRVGFRKRISHLRLQTVQSSPIGFAVKTV
jgi:hypothetical protein